MPRGTLPLTVSAAWSPPSSRSAGQVRPFQLAAGIGATGSPVPCQRLRRVHATFTRHGAPPGPHAGRSLVEGTPIRPLSPGRVPSPGFDADLTSFDASAVVHACSPSRRSPDPVLPGLFPERSRRRLLTAAPPGGLGSRLHGEPRGPTSITGTARFVLVHRRGPSPCLDPPREFLWSFPGDAVRRT